MDDYVIPNYSKKRRKPRAATRILTFTEKLEREMSSLKDDSEWLSKVHEMLKDALNRLQWTETPSLCCLGLGSPSESRSARLQLAMIIELLSYIEVPRSHASFYDPVFTEDDMKGFESLEVSAVTGKEALETTHIFSKPTLLIMPHCDIDLYATILKSNWSRENLSNILVLGNPLDLYLLTTSKKRLKSAFLPVEQIANHPDWCAIALPEATCDDKAFVALAFQYIANRHGISSDDESEFWTRMQDEESS